MPSHTNLVSTSVLVQDTLDMLRRCGGRATAIEVVELVMDLRNIDADFAAQLLNDVIRDDNRLRILDGCYVEMACENTEARLLSDSDFVVVDVEATGGRTPPGRIIEIGAYRVRHGRIVDQFETLVNPQTPIPPFIVRLTGITDDMVRNAPLFHEVAPKWLDFAGEAIIVAHNSRFDIKLLNYEVSRVFPGSKMSNANLCTVRLFRRTFPGLINYRLHTVAAHFEIPIFNRHRAGGDALATAEIFIRALERLRENGVRDLAAARRFRFVTHKHLSRRNFIDGFRNLPLPFDATPLAPQNPAQGNGNQKDDHNNADEANPS